MEEASQMLVEGGRNYEPLSSVRDRRPSLPDKELEVLCLDEEGTEADVFFEADMYDAVAVAAFGGVRVNLANDKSYIVHPFWLFWPGLILFLAQISTLTYLRFETDLDATVSPRFSNVFEGDPGFRTDLNYANGWEIKDNPVLIMQLLLVVIVQGMLFKETVAALRLMFFLLNPTTWSDMKRPEKVIFKCDVYSAVASLPWPVLALVWKLIVCYTVCVDSISIILAANSAKDAIFNSLVIMWIADLDVVCWNVIALVFNIDDFSHFVVQTAKKEVVQKRRKYIPSCFQCLRWPFDLLHRAKNGRQCETVCASVTTLLFGLRQLAVILYALDKDVLPAQRDICTLARWHKYQAKFFFFKFFAVLSKYFNNVLGLDDRLDYLVAHCDKIKHARMEWTNVTHMMTKHQYFFLACAIFFVPQVMLQVFKCIMEKCVKDEKGGDAATDANEEETWSGIPASLKKKLQAMERDIRKMKDT